MIGGEPQLENQFAYRGKKLVLNYISDCNKYQLHRKSQVVRI